MDMASSRDQGAADFGGLLASLSLISPSISINGPWTHIRVAERNASVHSLCLGRSRDCLFTVTQLAEEF